MKDGIVHQVDTPLNIYHHPVNKFVASFIGSPTMNFITGTIVQNGLSADVQNTAAGMPAQRVESSTEVPHSGTQAGRLKFMQERSNFALPIVSSMQDKLKTKSQITLGIRPEHIYAEKLAGIETLAPFKANIEVVEPVGNEIFVYFSTGTDSQYVARLATDTPPEVGKPFDLFFDTSKIHFFDKDTERAI
jgi:multiple sugar transport system ATP-binding protein